MNSSKNLKVNRKKDVELSLNLDDVKKCHENACRLFHDSLRTSKPTSAALLEIGIEELSKGMIVLWKMEMPDISKGLEGVAEFDKLTDDIENKMKSISGYNLKNFRYDDHKAKLEAIQRIFDTTKEISEIINKPLGSLIHPEPLLGNVFKDYDTTGLPLMNDLPEEFKKLDVRKWYKVKESGFYYDLNKKNILSNGEESFQIKDLLLVFFILHSYLLIYIGLYEGKHIGDLLSSKEPMLGCFYDIIQNG
jgi:hypothetical protein